MAIKNPFKKETVTLYFYYVPWIMALEEGGLTFGHSNIVIPFAAHVNIDGIMQSIKTEFEGKTPQVKAKSITCLNFVLLKTEEQPVPQPVQAVHDSYKTTHK